MSAQVTFLRQCAIGAEQLDRTLGLHYTMTCFAPLLNCGLHPYWGVCHRLTFLLECQDVHQATCG